MKLSLKSISLASMVVGALIAAPAFAQKKSAGETGLVGIKLFDNAYRVVSVYGTPDDVQALGAGGGGAIGGRGGGGAAPGGFGPPGGVPGAAPGGFPPRGGGGGPSAMGAEAPGGLTPGKSNSEFAFGDEILNQVKGGIGGGGTTPPPQGMGGGPMGGPPAGFGGPGGRPSGFGGPAGPSGGSTGPGPGGFGGGAPAGGNLGGGAAQETTFTRWIYNRNGSKYGFILDKFSRVVQIEAVGLTNAKVRTSRGVKFGANMAQIIRAYAGHSPDGYEIGGNSIIVRYLSKFKVAYRLNRLGQNKPHVVTGIVVAAGKG